MSSYSLGFGPRTSYSSFFPITPNFFNQFIRNKTMRVEIYNDPSEPAVPEEVLRVALRADGPSRVKLVAVSESGQVLPCGNLLTINTDGTIRLSSGVTAPGIRGSMKVVSGVR